MDNLLFVDSREQVEWIGRSGNSFDSYKIVAISAGALQALEELDISHISVSQYTDMKLIARCSKDLQVELVDLLEDLEDYFFDNYLKSKDDCKGFLLGHIYWLSHALTMLAARTHLLQESLKYFRPSKITLLSRNNDTSYQLYTSQPWYSSLPMGNITNELSSKYCVYVDLKSVEVSSHVQIDAFHIKLGQAVKMIKVIIKSLINRWLHKDNVQQRSGSMSSANLCLVGGVNKEWMKILCSFDDVRVNIFNWNNNISLDYFQGQGWSTVYDTKLSTMNGWVSANIGLDEYCPDYDEIKELSELYDKWVLRYKDTRVIDMNGINLLGDMLEIIRPLATYGVSVCRYVDKSIDRLFESYVPDIACFQGVIHMADKRMILACKERGIPTIGIQHGGSVGTHVNNRIEMNDWGFCDYYFSYGDGIRLQANPVVPQVSKLISIGSPSLEEDRDKFVREFERDNLDDEISILWISDKAYSNTIGHESRGEDNSRYELQKECLTIVGVSKNVKLIFRPFRTTEEDLGTVRWITLAGFDNIHVDSTSVLNKLLGECDLVITDNTASTVWNEVIAYDIPLILYCDPEQTPMIKEFTNVLQIACEWCKNQQDLINVMETLVQDPYRYTNELKKKNTITYLEKYVLHNNSQDSTELAVNFLNELIANND